ncbi:MAG: hypothetical protein ABIF71_04005 [Planctomycetota bacterium]
MRRLNALIAGWLKRPENMLVELVARDTDLCTPHLGALVESLEGRAVTVFHHYATRFHALNPFFPFNTFVPALTEHHPAKFEIAPSVYFIAPEALGKYVPKLVRGGYEDYTGEHKRILFTSGIIRLIEAQPHPCVFVVERFDRLSATAAEIFAALLKHAQGRVCVVATARNRPALAGAGLYRRQLIRLRGRPTLAHLRRGVAGLSPAEQWIVNILAVARTVEPELLAFCNERAAAPLPAVQLERLMDDLVRRGVVVTAGGLHRLASDDFIVERYNALDVSLRMNLHALTAAFYEQCLPERVHLQAVHNLFSENNVKAFRMFIDLGHRGLENGTGRDTLRELKLALSVLASLRDPGPEIRRERVELHYLISLLCFQEGDAANGLAHFRLFEKYSKAERDHFLAERLAVQARFVEPDPARQEELDRRRLGLFRSTAANLPAIAAIFARRIGQAMTAKDPARADRWLGEGRRRLRGPHRVYLITLLAARHPSEMGPDAAALESGLAGISEPAEGPLRADFHLLKSIIAHHRQQYDQMLQHQDVTLHEILKLGNYPLLQEVLTRFTSMNISARCYTHVQNQVENLARESGLFLEYFSHLGMMSTLARTINRRTGEQHRTAAIVRHEIAFLRNSNDIRALARAHEVLGDIFGEGPQPRANYLRALKEYQRAFDLRKQSRGKPLEWDYLNRIDCLIKLGRPRPARRLFVEFGRVYTSPTPVVRVDIWRVEAMLHAAEGDLAGAKKRFNRIVGPARRLDEIGHREVSVESIGRAMYEYGVFL